MNILLTGAAGQLGCELLPLLNQRGSVTALDRCKPLQAVPNWVTQDLDDGGISTLHCRGAWRVGHNAMSHA